MGYQQGSDFTLDLSCILWSYLFIVPKFGLKHIEDMICNAKTRFDNLNLKQVIHRIYLLPASKWLHFYNQYALFHYWRLVRLRGRDDSTAWKTLYFEPWGIGFKSHRRLVSFLFVYPLLLQIFISFRFMNFLSGRHKFDSTLLHAHVS